MRAQTGCKICDSGLNAPSGCLSYLRCVLALAVYCPFLWKLMQFVIIM